MRDMLMINFTVDVDTEPAADAAIRLLSESAGARIAFRHAVAVALEKTILDHAGINSFISVNGATVRRYSAVGERRPITIAKPRKVKPR